MFVDRVKVFVKGGDGGRGCVSFRREPYVPRGGPDGGHGGEGGSVFLLAVSHQNTLLPLRYHTEYRAERGEHGGPGNRTGARGADLLVSVPPGTVAADEATGDVLGEVLSEGQRLLLARGGRGGKGNRAFLSNRNRAPREEVRQRDPALLERPQIVAATKRDPVASPDPLPGLEAEARRSGLEVWPVSAVSGEGLAELKRALARLVREGGTAGPGGNARARSEGRRGGGGGGG